MIRSMTGFGEAAAMVDGVHYGVEIRSVNNKFFKAQVRLPDELQGLEAEIEAAVAKRINRGSVIVTVRFTDVSAKAAARINTEAVQCYLEQILTVPGLKHVGVRVDIGGLLALPGVIITETSEQRLDEARSVLLRLVDEACDRLQAMRIREGETLRN